MSLRITFLVAVVVLILAHVGYHVTGREPGTLALASRFCLAGVLFVTASALRRERLKKRQKEASEKPGHDSDH